MFPAHKVWDYVWIIKGTHLWVDQLPKGTPFTPQLILKVFIKLKKFDKKFYWF